MRRVSHTRRALDKPLNKLTIPTTRQRAVTATLSLFEDTDKSINLIKIWQGFDHPFDDELETFVKKLEPFKDELRQVRNRVWFHGSLTRSREKTGLGIFDVESSRAREFVRLVREMHNLALKMIKWYIDGMSEAKQPQEKWQELG